MKKKLVTVVITTYGERQNFLLEAIESVKRQTYPNIEIIIVDDNGLSSPAQVKNQKIFLKDKDLIYIAKKENNGVQISRNIGILKSKGDYIAFLDDDDIWMPNKIEKQVELLEKEDLGMVFCNGYRFYNDNLEEKKLYQFNFISDSLITYQLQLKSDRIGTTSNPLIRKECFTKSGLFDIRMPARQDYEMWLRICKYYKVQGINIPLFYYRYHKGERITKSYKKEIISYELLYRKYKEDYKKDSQAKAQILLVLGVSFFKNKNYMKAMITGFKSCLTNFSVVVKLLRERVNKRNVF